MPVALSLVNVSKAFGAQPILENLSFGLMQGEKVGLIGRNGVGKSTLFKLLSGEDTPDTGEVVITQGQRISRLSQEPVFAEGATVREALLAALEDHRALLARHHEVLEALHGASGEAEVRLHDELEHLEHKLHHWGWDLEPRLKAGAYQWGLMDLDVPVASLSGGWRKRVALAQAWLKEPDVLVLDEPTNHLDPDQVEKLEGWLQAFPGALLLITHDRHLLDGVVDRMLELEGGKVTSYDGSYSDYLVEKAEQDFRESRLTDHMENRLRRELAWLRRGAKARTRKSKIRIQDALDLKDDVQERTRITKSERITFQDGGNRSHALLVGEGIHFAYPGGRELLGGLDFILQKGMRVALLGPNGCGKSTVLKVLLGELEPKVGALKRQPRMTVTAISQGRGELDGDRSIIENLADRAAVVNTPTTTLQAHVYLTRFGFPVNQQNRAASSLSGGERNRLLLAKAMLSASDLLVLDEPTNDLDIPTLQNLEEALSEYPGALLLVSHDRFFLDQVATHTLAWNPEADDAAGLGSAASWGGTGGISRPQGAGGPPRVDIRPRWELYEGNPATVKSLREQRAAEAKAVEKAAAPKAAPEPARARKPGLTQKEQRRLAEVEAGMATLHARIEALEAVLADPMAFASLEAPGQEALKARDGAKAELEDLELEWLELEERRTS